VSPLPRLLGYSRRYKGRAAASAAVAYLIKPIIDEGLQPTGARAHLPDPRTLLFWSSAVLIAYLVKGLGAYFSAYLMTDIAHPRSVGGVLQPLVHGPADVADHQRRRPGAAGSFRDGRRSAP
jgi:hypothetical protein